MDWSLLTLYRKLTINLYGGLAVAACAALAGCGGGGANAPASPAPTPQAQHFALRIQDGGAPGLGSAAGYQLSQAQTASGTVVSVSVQGARGLKALYFALDYDAGRYQPRAVEAAGPLAGDDVLQLAVLDRPATVYYGAVFANWDRHAGLNGDQLLARVKFGPAPAAEGAQVAARVAAAAPTSAASGNVHLQRGSGSLGAILFSWKYANQGDYNQDGLVGVSDLTPLGLNFGASGPFEDDTALWMIDGDGNGEIGVSDITPVGANFGASALGGYNVYTASDFSSYPAANDAASSDSPAGNVTFDTATGDSATDRLAFSTEFTPMVGAGYAWVRPVDGDGAEGTPSNWVLLSDSVHPALALLNPPASGTGTIDDPYIADVSEVYEFQVTFPTFGDVTTDPQTEYQALSLVPPPPGTVDHDSGTLDIDDDFTGLFGVLAAFGGIAADPALVFRVIDPSNMPPVASFTFELAGSEAPTSATLDASSSFDEDGIVWSYEWDTNDDGVFEPSLGTSAVANFDNGGSFIVTLRVVDDDGAEDISTQEIDVSGWQPQTLDSTGDTGMDPSLAMIGGRPAIAYRGDGGNLSYLRAADPLAHEWQAPSLVSESYEASQISLSEVDGGVGIAFRRSWPGEYGIHYAYSASPDGGGWTVAGVSTHENDHSPSLAVVAGSPAIAYAWYGGGPDFDYELFYHRSATANGVDTGSWDGFPAYLFGADTIRLEQRALALIDGKPAVFFISNNGELGQSWRVRLIKADDELATGWGFPAPLNGGGSPEEFRYLAAGSALGLPDICWRRMTSGDASYRSAQESTATDWSSLYAVGDVLEDNTRGYFLTLAEVDGFPALCHYDSSNRQLRYVLNDATPPAVDWSGGKVVANVGEWDTATDYDAYVSMLELDGQPLIAYYDAVNADLVVTRYYLAP